MFTRDSTELTDPEVVPSLADGWSHHTGGTHFKVVPCHWRATVELDDSSASYFQRLFEAAQAAALSVGDDLVDELLTDLMALGTPQDEEPL